MQLVWREFLVSNFQKHYDMYKFKFLELNYYAVESKITKIQKQQNRKKVCERNVDTAWKRKMCH